MSAVDLDKVWVYHERQQALLCGQHALNNLVQSGTAFTAGELANIAQQLDATELQFMAQNNEGGIRSPDYQRRLAEGSHHVDSQGNFSIEVLKAALQNKYGIQLPYLSQKDLAGETQGKDITDYQGFLCHKSDHWFAIRQIGGRFWNLNSTLELPVVISHFKLAVEMQNWQNEGYTVFCVPSGLPEGGIKPKQGHSTAAENHWWHRMSDLLKGKSTAKDPWENVGSGIRLDGKSTMNGTAPAAASAMSIEGLSEEEQLQLAMQASIEQSISNHEAGQKNDSTTNLVPGPAPPEPAQGSNGAVRIQFRLPGGGKPIVRRFLNTDSVDGIYAFVQEHSGGRPVELRSGYPPKDISSCLGQTIADAKLANESIQCRFL